eukprot:3129536-Amphidinium_carterae.1
MPSSSWPAELNHVRAVETVDKNRGTGASTERYPSAVRRKHTPQIAWKNIARDGIQVMQAINIFG